MKRLDLKLKILVILAFLFSSTLYAQSDYEVGKTYPGFIVIKKDTIQGHLILLNRLSSQNKVIFIGDMKQPVITRKNYGPDDLVAYSVGGELYESISYSDALNSHPRNFACKIEEGQISLYEWYSFATHVTIKKVDDPQKPIEDKKLRKEILIRKGKQPPVTTAGTQFLNFKKGMGDMVRDNRELLKKVEDKVYTREYLLQIVQEYNEWFANKKRR